MVVIIGAGLSGLLIGCHLKDKGVPFKILEARNRIGGRIHTIESENNTPVEMGATWFGQQHQNLIELLENLNIPYFKQYMEGTSFFQQFSNSPAEAIRIPQQAPSYRMAGGTRILINRLYEKLNQQDVLLNQFVKKIKKLENSILIEAEEQHEAKIVVLAIPPKLWAHKISFEPALPNELIRLAKQTHTWMEDSIKVALVYEKPFWRIKKQSGTFFSNAGPIAEFYDHSTIDESKFALCGFLSPKYEKHTFEERKEAVVNQLKMVFGEEATHFLEYKESIWSEEKNTFHPSEFLLHPHQNNGHPIFKNKQFENSLLFSSTEVSSHFGGYMEGAVYSASETAQKIIQLL